MKFLTENQINLIWKFFSNPIICLDGDVSGQKAALRIAESLLPHIKDSNKIGFVTLSKGVDPDDFIKEKWGQIDFIVHSIAHSDKNELNGKYIDTSRENFLKTLEVSCFSLTNITKTFEPLINDNGSILTLTYGGSERVIPNYNVMGVAKAALESSVRYLAVDLGDRGIRINALSAGMMRTLAGSAVKNARSMFNFAEKHKPLKNIPLDLEDIGSSGLYLLSDLSRGVTGEIHYVDQGYNFIGMPKTDNLKD